MGEAYVGVLHSDGTFDARYAGLGWQMEHLPFALAKLWTKGTAEIPAADTDALTAVLLAHDWQFVGTPKQVRRRRAKDIAWLSQDGEEPDPDDLPAVIAELGIVIGPSDADDIDGPFIRITADQLPDWAIAYLLDPATASVRLVPAGFRHPVHQSFRLDSTLKGKP